MPAMQSLQTKASSPKIIAWLPSSIFAANFIHCLPWIVTFEYPFSLFYKSCTLCFKRTNLNVWRWLLRIQLVFYAKYGCGRFLCSQSVSFSPRRSYESAGSSGGINYTPVTKSRSSSYRASHGGGMGMMGGFGGGGSTVTKKTVTMSYGVSQRVGKVTPLMSKFKLFSRIWLWAVSAISLQSIRYQVII